MICFLILLNSLKLVADLLQEALPAELTKASDLLIQQINNLAAASGDVLQLGEVVPPLVSVSRYGNVRKTDADLVLNIVESMIVRICISLSNAVTGIDEEASENLLELFYKLNDAISVVQQSSITKQWQQSLKIISVNTQS